MSACCPHSISTGRLFSRLARRYRRRFERRGLEPSQRQLFDALERIGFTNSDVLEVGCGVGQFHQLMLEHGARRATGIDLAPKMIVEAKGWALERGLADRSHYETGDFVQMNLPRFDITILDKVICCYPDIDVLIDRTVRSTRNVIGLTLPRYRHLTRFAAAASAPFFKLFCSDFRSYVHDPQLIDKWLVERGFRCCDEARTPIWLTRIYSFTS
ncbi:MAG: hypothetical protein DHS20C01_18250 [marine bacterium B5-7]|nr:MAG: hypothetical protein DHS20C01_18250 [marine bacterium B5-7]